MIGHVVEWLDDIDRINIIKAAYASRKSGPDKELRLSGNDGIKRATVVKFNCK